MLDQVPWFCISNKSTMDVFSLDMDTTIFILLTKKSQSIGFLFFFLLSSINWGLRSKTQAFVSTSMNRWLWILNHYFSRGKKQNLVIEYRSNPKYGKEGSTEWMIFAPLFIFIMWSHLSIQFPFFEKIIIQQKCLKKKTQIFLSFQIQILKFSKHLIFLLRAAPEAYRGSQARGRTGATAANLHHSSTATPTEWGQGSNLVLMDTSRNSADILIIFKFLAVFEKWSSCSTAWRPSWISLRVQDKSLFSHLSQETDHILLAQAFSAASGVLETQSVSFSLTRLMFS